MPRSDDSKLSYKGGLKYQVGLLLARFEKSENDAEAYTLFREELWTHIAKAVKDTTRHNGVTQQRA